MIKFSIVTRNVIRERHDKPVVTGSDWNFFLLFTVQHIGQSAWLSLTQLHNECSWAESVLLSLPTGILH